MMEIKDFHLATFSNPYYDFLDNFAQSEYESAKLLGKFYTDYAVAEEMIDRVVTELGQHNKTESIRIIDPFCGDGRLIIKLLQVMAERRVTKPETLYIYLWDVDESSVKSAEKAIRETAAQYNFNVQVTAEKTDTFVSCFEVEGTFDVCVTNPPWGLLKPLKLFNSRCNEEELETYKASIAGYDDYMRQEYLVSQPTSKFGRWGTNLGRCGLEVALRLISSTGVCGFVSPASLFNDQVSIPFRKLNCMRGQRLKAVMLRIFPKQQKQTCVPIPMSIPLRCVSVETRCVSIPRHPIRSDSRQLSVMSAVMRASVPIPTSTANCSVWAMPGHTSRMRDLMW